MPSSLPTPLWLSGHARRGNLPSTPVPRPHRPARLSLGFTLLEIITVLTILGLALGEVLPVGRHLMDRMAVLGAREATIGLFHRVRMRAVAEGGARLVVEISPPAMRIVIGESSVGSEELVLDNGVELALSRNRTVVEFTFDAMGLGRVASQTLRFSRGRAQADLVVSSFGRIKRK